MKKLTGMKSNFSSFENKKMKNLQSIKGGSASSRSAPSGYRNSDGTTTVDADVYSDNTPGVWTYKTRFVVGQATSSLEPG